MDPDTREQMAATGISGMIGMQMRCNHPCDRFAFKMPVENSLPVF